MARLRAPASVVPFSKDYEREEAFALGIINRRGPGFPDTLRQFRVPGRPVAQDSLAPQTHGSPPAGDSARPPHKPASLRTSLAVGFAVGVALAFAAVSWPRPGKEPLTTAVAVQGASARGSVASAAGASAASTAAIAPSSVAATVPSSMAATAPSSTAVSARAATRPQPTPEMERRWLLDRARAEQRAYRLSAAERLYRQVLARAPRDSEALSGMGELALLRGTTDLADAHFREALNANPNYIPAMVAVADIHWQSGRTEEAQSAYRNIVEHHSDDSYPPYVIQRSSAIAAPVCER
jgi:Flp pilus assembly protein TadD